MAVGVDGAPHAAHVSSVDYEKALIGSLLLSAQDVLPAASSANFSAVEFADYRARAAWEIACELDDAGRDVDFLTVSGGFDTRQMSSDVPWLMESMNSVPTHIHAQTYMEHVRDGHIRRSVSLFAQRAIQAAGSERSAESLMSSIEEMFSALPKPTESGDPRMRTVSTASDAALDLLSEVQDNLELRRAGKVVGVKTHIDQLDVLFGNDGFMPGYLVVAYGPEGSGKSLIADNMVVEQAKQYLAKNDPSLILDYTTERHRTQVVGRWTAAQLGIPASTLFSANFEDTPDMWDKVLSALEDVAFKNVIISHADPTIEGIRRDVRRLHRSGQIVGLIVVDFVQFMTLQGTQAGVTTAEHLKRVIYGLKSLAREERVVVFAISSVNYQGLIEGAKAISHSAEIIMAVGHHPEISGAKRVKLIKNRHGPAGEEVVLYMRDGWFHNDAPLMHPAPSDVIGIVPDASIDDWGGETALPVDAQGNEMDLESVTLRLADRSLYGAVVIGKARSGKTRLACAMANSLIAIAPRSAILHRGGTNITSEDVKNLEHVGILIVDDIDDFSQPWSLTNLRDLLEARAVMRLPTIMTTGVVPGKLVNAWGRLGASEGAIMSIITKPGFQPLYLP